VKPAAQLVTQAPAAQLWPGAHATPQAPQWDGSRWRSAHWRAPAPSAQVARPAAQVVAQAPPEQTWPAGHAVPQAPQLVLSVWRLAQATRAPPSPPCAQAVCPVGQTTWHAPATQLWPAAQALPQAPQLAGSVITDAQTAPHSRCEAPHVGPRSVGTSIAAGTSTPASVPPTIEVELSQPATARAAARPKPPSRIQR
jgi:hypothetical protein